MHDKRVQLQRKEQNRANHNSNYWLDYSGGAMELDLIIFNLGQAMLVIICGYLMVLGLGVFLERVNLLSLRYYQIKKQKLELKEQIKELESIEKVEPDEY